MEENIDRLIMSYLNDSFAYMKCDSTIVKRKSQSQRDGDSTMVSIQQYGGLSPLNCRASLWYARFAIVLSRVAFIVRPFRKQV